MPAQGEEGGGEERRARYGLELVDDVLARNALPFLLRVEEREGEDRFAGYCRVPADRVQDWIQQHGAVRPTPTRGQSAAAKIQPHSTELERAILGAVLQEPETLVKVLEATTPEH